MKNSGNHLHNKFKNIEFSEFQKIWLLKLSFENGSFSSAIPKIHIQNVTETTLSGATEIAYSFVQCMF